MIYGSDGRVYVRCVGYLRGMRVGDTHTVDLVSGLSIECEQNSDDTEETNTDDTISLHAS